MRKLGVRVRRQHALAPYIVDFYVPSSRLVIEINGAYHLAPEQRAADAHRERELVQLHGVRILRLAAELVQKHTAAAVAIIRAAL
jgi:very-short-patch-repair endonuclease